MKRLTLATVVSAAALLLVAGGASAESTKICAGRAPPRQRDAPSHFQLNV
jgi:hypothetical protein